MKRLLSVFLALIAAGAFASSLFQTAALQDTTIGLGQSFTATTTTDGSDVHYALVNVLTTETTNTFNTEIGLAGMCYIENKSSDTNSVVEVGFASSTYNMRFQNNQAALFPLATNQTALYMKASGTNSLVVLYVHEL